MPGDSNEWAAVTVGSRKGYGPMASTTARLQSKLAYTGPGPGSYQPREDCGNSSHGLGSAAFLATGRSLHLEETPTKAIGSQLVAPPGPGAHGIPLVANTGAVLLWGSLQRPGAAAAFKAPPRSTKATATGIREQLVRSKFREQQPVPWLLSPPVHTAQRPLPGPKRQPIHTQTACGTKQRTHSQPHHAIIAVSARPAITKSCPGGQLLGASVQQLATSQGHTPVLPLKTPVAANICTRDGCDRSSWQHRSTTAPGPGAYDVDKYGMQWGAVHTYRSAFCQSLVQDRFGHCQVVLPAQHAQQQQQSPAALQQKLCAEQLPGSWRLPQPSSRMSSRQPGVSAGFRSRSPGHHEALLNAADGDMVGSPGPTYYNPQVMPHKTSYRHPNTVRSFVAAV